MPVFIRDVEVVVDRPETAEAGPPAPGESPGTGGGRVSGTDLQRALAEIEWRRRRVEAE